MVHLGRMKISTKSLPVAEPFTAYNTLLLPCRPFKLCMICLYTIILRSIHQQHREKASEEEKGALWMLKLGVGL